MIAGNARTLTIAQSSGAKYRDTVQVTTATANSSGKIIVDFTNGTADQPQISEIEVQ